MLRLDLGGDRRVGARLLAVSVVFAPGVAASGGDLLDSVSLFSVLAADVSTVL